MSATREEYEKQQLANASVNSHSSASDGRELEIHTDADNLPQVLKPIIVGYLYNHIGATPFPYARDRTLFGNLAHLYTRLAALRLLQGDTVTTEALVEKNPAILYCIVEVTDYRGNKVKGTLLQIAALTGDCNIRELQIPEKDHGMVERLKTYLPFDVAIKQLQATRPVGWEQATAARMQPYFDAATEFLNDILSTQQAPGSNYEAFKTACKAHITKFRNTLALIPSQQPVITTGLIFDPQIFTKAINDLLVKNIDRLGGRNTDDKSVLFAIVGFGGLQACASACDLQAMRKGLYYVGRLPRMLRAISKDSYFDNVRPDRSLNFVAGWPQSLAGLGDSVLVDIFGARRGVRETREGGEMAVSWWYGWVVDKADSEYALQNYVRAKAVSFQCAMQQPDNHAKNRCVIL